MKIIDIVNLLKDEGKELFHKAFNIWCNFIYEKDAVYTEELVTVFMNDIFKNVYILAPIHNTVIKDADGYFLIRAVDEVSYMSEYTEDKLIIFIKEYGTNRIN